MDTITAVIVDHEPVEFSLEGAAFPIPVVVGFNADGTIQTLADLNRRQRIDPAACDHAGATWISNLDMRCPKCGSPMFLPPKLLAYLPAATISAMDLLWSAAGWPEWCGQKWNIDIEHWTIMQNPFFDHCGGIPVRNGRLTQFQDALFSLTEDDLA